MKIKNDIMGFLIQMNWEEHEVKKVIDFLKKTKGKKTDVVIYFEGIKKEYTLGDFFGRLGYTELIKKYDL